MVGASAPTRLRIGAPERAQASGGAVAGGCRCSRGWTGVSVSGEEGEVFQPTAARIAAGPVDIETSVAAPLWQAPTQLQEEEESAGASPCPCELCARWSSCPACANQ